MIIPLNWRAAISRALGCLLLAACILLPAACNTLPAENTVYPVPEGTEAFIILGTEQSPEIPTREPSECPDLDSLLYQIATASEPQELAEQFNLRVEGDSILVAIKLQDSESGFLADFGAKISKQEGSQVEAFAPLKRLCEIANHPAVLAVQPPSEAVGG